MKNSTRLLSIDRMRGLLVILMVAGNYLAGIEFVPAFLKHAQDIGFTIADAVAPAFVFVIGLNYGPSFMRRFTIDKSMAYRDFLKRYLALIGIGSIISGGAYMVGMPSGWGVLQALGVAGLITLACITWATWARFTLGIAILIGYQVLLETLMLETVLSSIHGGLFGAVSWAALLILSTAVADVWRKGKSSYLLCIFLLGLLVAISVIVVPVSKHRVSLSFVLLALLISALVFLAFDSLSAIGPKRPGLFSWWGESALALYLMHLIALAPFVSIPITWWYAQAPLWLAIAQLFFILTVLSMFAWWLHRRRQAKIVAKVGS